MNQHTRELLTSLLWETRNADGDLSRAHFALFCKGMIAALSSELAITGSEWSRLNDLIDSARSGGGQ